VASDLRPVPGEEKTAGEAVFANLAKLPVTRDKPRGWAVIEFSRVTDRESLFTVHRSLATGRLIQGELQ